MGIFSKTDDENCIDGEAFLSRDFPGDRIIKILAKLPLGQTEVEIESELYYEFKDQTGSKWSEYVYGPYNKVKLLLKD